MNNTQLRYFLAVYEARGIKAAAEKLFISPQGLSKTILHLEKELGYPLFEREGKKMVPTSSADLFKVHAEKILQEYELIRDGRFLRGAERKRLKVLHTYGVMESFGIECIGRFIERHPNILPALIEIPDRDALTRLKNGDGEIAILSDPINISDYETIPIYTEHYCFVVNRENPLSQRDAIYMEDFDGSALIIKGSELVLSDYQMTQLAKRNIVPRITLETTNYYFAAAMAQRDKNVIALTLASIAEMYLPENTVAIPYGEKIDKPLFLVYRKERSLSREAEEFKAFIKDYFAQ